MITSMPSIVLQEAQPMLDIVLLRKDQGGNPDLVRESQRRRYADVTLVDKVIEYDEEWRQSASVSLTAPQRLA